MTKFRKSVAVYVAAVLNEQISKATYTVETYNQLAVVAVHARKDGKFLRYLKIEEECK